MENIKEFNSKVFSDFNDSWALISAGSKDNNNSMTISWGGLGTLWSKPVCTVYVRPSRYTFKFIENNEYFTISFFDEKFRDDLKIMGSKSGRDGNKINLTKLSIRDLGKSITFNEAYKTLLCKKIYYQDMDLSKFPKDVINTYYDNDTVHRLYIGEVIAIY